MTLDAATDPPHLADEQTKRDARCIRCGYDLRGHDVGGRCPECGLKAHWSLKAPILLSQYPALWVAAMARGVKLLSAAYLVLFVMLILAVGGALEGYDWILLGALFIAAVMQVAGAWMLSASSRHWSEPRSPLTRLALRVASPLLLLGVLGALWLTLDYREPVAVLTSLAMLASPAAPIAAFVRLRTVARMISDADLMEHASVVGGGFLASVVAGAALYVFMGFTGSGSGSDDGGHEVRGAWTTFALFAIIISLLLFLLWGAFLMFCCIIDFSQAARIATADWRNDEAAAAGSAT